MIQEGFHKFVEYEYYTWINGYKIVWKHYATTHNQIYVRTESLTKQVVGFRPLDHTHFIEYPEIIFVFDKNEYYGKVINCSSVLIEILLELDKPPILGFERLSDYYKEILIS